MITDHVAHQMWILYFSNCRSIVEPGQRAITKARFMDHDAKSAQGN